MQGGRLEAEKHQIFRVRATGRRDRRPRATTGRRGIRKDVDQAAAASLPRADSTSDGTSRISPTWPSPMMVAPEMPGTFR